MAKGLRSSVKKSNRTKLRARVFQPVEEARLERLHQKLLETAQQPKPETAKEKEMDVDSAEGERPLLPLAHPTLLPQPLTNPPTDAAANAASKEEDFPKGSFFLSAGIPPALLHDTPTPPPTPTEKLSPADHDDESTAFYHLLGLCSDVVGFAPNGALQFAFDPLSP